MPVLDATFQRFIPNYGASLPDQPALERTMVLWAEQLVGQPWVTDAIFHRARNLILTQHDDKYLPPFKVVLDYCHEAKAQLDRETERRDAELRVKLPPPKPVPGGWKTMTGPQRAVHFERHLAIGKLRARTGITDLDVEFDPPEEDIAAVVAEIRRTGFCRKVLERIATREDAPLAEVGAEVAGAWPR